MKEMKENNDLYHHLHNRNDCEWGQFIDLERDDRVKVRYNEIKKKLEYIYKTNTYKTKTYITNNYITNNYITNNYITNNYIINNYNKERKYVYNLITKKNDIEQNNKRIIEENNKRIIEENNKRIIEQNNKRIIEQNNKIEEIIKEVIIVICNIFYYFFKKHDE